MSEHPSSGSLPPEVPEEFAAAYRAAYEQALAAQTDGPQHREVEAGADTGPRGDGGDDDGEVAPDHDLPVRSGRLRVGNHRSPGGYAESPTWFERVRDSTWFVPILLGLLAVLLILGAYLLGRGFAAQMRKGPSSGHSLVTGGTSAES